MLFLFRFIFNQTCIINRKLTIFLLTVAFSISSNGGIIYVPANSTDNAKAGKISTTNLLGQLDAKTFLSLTPAKVQEMIGKKPMLRFCLIFLALGIVCLVLAWVIWPLIYLAGLAFLASGIFFILWIISVSA